MASPDPQEQHRDAFGDEILPFDGDTDLLNLNLSSDDPSNEEQPINWEEVEGELESWTAGGEGTEGSKDAEDL